MLDYNNCITFILEKQRQCCDKLRIINIKGGREIERERERVRESDRERDGDG